MDVGRLAEIKRYTTPRANPSEMALPHYLKRAVICRPGIELRRVVDSINTLAEQHDWNSTDMVAVGFLCTECGLCIEYFGCEFFLAIGSQKARSVGRWPTLTEDERQRFELPLEGGTE